mgnify:FL=1
MKKIEKYYNNTKNIPPNYITQKFIKLKIKPTNAIELGCGAGRDTEYLIKNGWEVLAIDKEDVKSIITSRLSKEEQKNFKFSKQEFENIQLEKTNLIVANFSLPFCNQNQFVKLWNKINESILKNGYFVGNFFGNNDEWKKQEEEMTFLTKEQVIELFKNFEIIDFKEVEKDCFNGLGIMKHRHIFNVIAKKL